MNSEFSSAKRLTPIGRGAVATLRVEGDLSLLDQHFQAANGLSAAQQILNRICYGFWGGDHREDLVGVRTDDSVFELHCHGGSAAVERILCELEQSGMQIDSVQAADSSQTSFLEEFQFCLQRATTKKTAHHLLRQSQIFPKVVEELNRLDKTEAREVINEMLRWSDFGQHLYKPWQVVLCGSPNVGKSSLINALVGFSRSVVFDQPGTTRDVVTVETALEGWPIQFSDTAGLRMTTEGLEALGIEKAKASIETADLLLVVVDSREAISSSEMQLYRDHPKSLLVMNKIDLLDDQLLPPESIPVSAMNKEGVEGLASRIVQELVPETPSDQQALPVTSRQQEFLKSLL